MSFVENFIANKVYDALFLDILLKVIWEKVIELWQIGGSAIPAAFILLLLMIVIALIPLIHHGLVYWCIKKAECFL
jgi:hypothetical protein